MAKLTTAKRKKLPTTAFGLPAERAYPVSDSSHAANAKARASQQVKKGDLSAAQKATIDAKANAVLGTKKGAASKKKGKKKKAPGKMPAAGY